MYLLLSLFVLFTAASTALSQTGFSTYPPPSTTTTRIYCSLNCINYPNTYEDYNTCRCECKPGYFQFPFIPGCTSLSTWISSIPPISTTSYYPRRNSPEVFTTTQQKCELQSCGAGSLMTDRQPCECLCYEFHYFDSSAKKCVLKSYYPTVQNCDECKLFQGTNNRPMRCIQTSTYNFCVP